LPQNEHIYHALKMNYASGRVIQFLNNKHPLNLFTRSIYKSVETVSYYKKKDWKIYLQTKRGKLLCDEMKFLGFALRKTT